MLRVWGKANTTTLFDQVFPPPFLQTRKMRLKFTQPVNCREQESNEVKFQGLHSFHPHHSAFSGEQDICLASLGDTGYLLRTSVFAYGMSQSC